MWCGRRTNPDKIRPGDIVVDTENDWKSPAVTTEFSLKTAEMYHIEELGKTVAEANPEYPDYDQVVTVAFINEFEKKFPIWREADRAVLDQWADKFNVQTYSYPQTRLRKVIYND
jgi:hypothetical protein